MSQKTRDVSPCGTSSVRREIAVGGDPSWFRG